MLLKTVLYLPRYHPNNDDFEISVEYQAIADFNDNITSRSNACNRTINHSGFKINGKGSSKEIHIAVVIAAPEE
jgi:hypothetical protein